MKRLCFALIAALMLNVFALAALAETRGTYYGDMTVVNCKEWVSLRAEPSTKAVCLAEVPLGVVVSDCSVYSDDFMLCYYEGKVGYILRKYLEKVGQEQSGVFGDMTVVNCEEWVSLRSGASTSSARLAKIPLGATVEECSVCVQNPAFVRGTYNGQTGFVLRQYLSEAGASNLFEDGFPAEMLVVNCEEWVSLRAKPDTKSARLATVPLNAVVSDCQPAGKFIFCQYGGRYGYILTEYLAPYFGSEGAAEYDLLLSGGESVLMKTLGGYTLVATREFVGYGEHLKLGCFDAAGRTVWTAESATGFTTELTMTDAFIAGTPEMPLVMVYNAERGLTALNFFTGEEVWTVMPDEADLGASISWAVDEGGTIYIGGYYGPDPVAIDIMGNVLWKSNASDDFYWLYEIELGELGIVAHYDHAGDGGSSGSVLYDESGHVIGTRTER